MNAPYRLQKIQTEDDFRKIFPLLALLRSEESTDDQGSEPVEDFMFSFKAAQAQGYFIVAAFSEQHDVLGIIGVSVFYDPASLKPAARINNLIVSPPCRAQGIGSSLVEEALRLARQAHAACVILEVFDDNEQAINFYSRFGFERFCHRMIKTIKL